MSILTATEASANGTPAGLKPVEEIKTDTGIVTAGDLFRTLFSEAVVVACSDNLDRKEELLNYGVGRAYDGKRVSVDKLRLTNLTVVEGQNPATPLRPANIEIINPDNDKGGSMMGQTLEGDIRYGIPNGLKSTVSASADLEVLKSRAAHWNDFRKAGNGIIRELFALRMIAEETPAETAHTWAAQKLEAVGSLGKLPPELQKVFNILNNAPESSISIK